MTVLFKLKPVIYYAFSDDDSLIPTSCLTLKQFNTFLDILRKEIRKHRYEHSHYTYVKFDWDEFEYNQFFTNHQDLFFHWIDEIYLIDKIPEWAVSWVEEKYNFDPDNPVIINALRTARKAIREEKK